MGYKCIYISEDAKEQVISAHIFSKSFYKISTTKKQLGVYHVEALSLWRTHKIKDQSATDNTNTWFKAICNKQYLVDS